MRKCYGLNDEGLKAGKSRRLYFSQNIQMTLQPTQPCIQLIEWALSPELKVARI
jgi:hypothetical protein